MILYFDKNLFQLFRCEEPGNIGKIDGDEDLKRLTTKDVTLKVAHIEYAHKRLAFIMQASGEK